jgi:hypothetical protein
MSELAHRRPQSVAEAQTVDYTKALNYLGLSPGQPAAQALILVCQRYDLDPLLQHIEILDGKVYVKYAGYLHIANSSSHYQGAECVREWDDETYYWATVRVHRDDRMFYAERTGKSRKIKPKRGGGTYVDDEADAKAFAQAHRRALRLAFNVDHPEPAEDHGETPAPGPVVEVARMVGEQGTDVHESRPHQRRLDALEQMSGAGERGPTSAMGRADHRHDPAPGPTSGTVAASGRRAAPPSRPDKPSGDGAVPDHTSPPAVGGGLAPRAAGPGGGDPTSSSPASPGKAAGGDGPTSAAAPHQGDEPAAATPTQGGDAVAQATDGEGPEEQRGVPSTANPTAPSASAGPTPPIEQRSPVLAWCLANNVNPGMARFQLAHDHAEHFGTGSAHPMRTANDLMELKGAAARRAIEYLKAWKGEGDG